MALVKEYGEMWARNLPNINEVPGSKSGGKGFYVLYAGSMPVYIGIGNIRQRLKKARLSKRRRKMWDRFSWYVPRNAKITRDIECLLLRMLPVYLRILTRQRGRFHDATRMREKHRVPELFCRAKSL
jgi:hypothetical protein